MNRFVIFIVCCQFHVFTGVAHASFTSIEKFLRSKIKTPAIPSYEDKVTSAHELTHMLHGELRLKMCKAGENCFLLPDGSTFIILEPQISKSSIADYVPEHLRGKHFKHYVEDSIDWEKYPSYLIDEWIAYYRGAQAGIEAYDARGPKRDVFSGLVELAIYSNAILAATRAQSPRFYHSGKGDIYRKLIAKMNRQTVVLAKQIMRMPKLFVKNDQKLLSQYLGLVEKKRASKEARKLKVFPNNF